MIQEGTIHNIEEEDKVANFTRTGCRHTLYLGGPCNKAFSAEHLSSIHSQCQELDYSSFDLVLFGQIMATNSQSSLAIRNLLFKRRQKNSYYYQGVQIC